MYYFLFVTLALCIVTASGEHVMVMLGRTGDGKSTTGNLFARILEFSSSKVFEEGEGPESHTQAPKAISNGLFEIVDTPGLMDNKGAVYDEKNMIEIVKYLKGKGKVNGFILVVNEQAPRFDDGMQNAVKLLVDTFGPQMLKQTGVLFTRSLTLESDHARDWVVTSSKLLGDRIGYSVDPLPFWRSNAYPEEAGVTAERLVALNAMNVAAVTSVKNWVVSQSDLDVSNATPGIYEATRIQNQLKEDARIAEENAIDPSKNKGECREVRLRSSGASSRRYGPRCSGLWGPREYRDFWDDVTYRRECITYYFKKSGEAHSDSGWSSTGEFTRVENKRRRNVC